MNGDSKTTLSTLKELLAKFRDEREWLQFHDPENLAEAISVESSELLDLFLWKSVADGAQLLNSDETFRKRVEEELADIFCFCLNFANTAKIDVASAVMAKVAINEEKYPVDKARGKATKYTDL